MLSPALLSLHLFSFLFSLSLFIYFSVPTVICLFVFLHFDYRIWSWRGLIKIIRSLGVLGAFNWWRSRLVISLLNGFIIVIFVFVFIIPSFLLSFSLSLIQVKCWQCFKCAIKVNSGRGLVPRGYQHQEAIKRSSN